jgi:hypothetical protein
MIWEWRPERVRCGDVGVNLGRSPHSRVRCFQDSF